MPVDATWRIQADSGTVTSTTGFTATLPNPTQDGGTLLLFAAHGSGLGVSLPIGSQSFDPPFYQDQSHSGLWYAWRRPAQPAGESSWAITPSSATNALWTWRVEEWAGLSTVGQPDASGNLFQAAGVLTVPTDGSSACTADADDFVALAVYKAGAGLAFPAGHSYGAGTSAGPSAWNEVFYSVNGTGTTTGDFILAIAEAYPGVSGDVAGSIIWDISGGGAAPNACDAWCVCYQPATADPSSGVLTA